RHVLDLRLTVDTVLRGGLDTRQPGHREVLAVRVHVRAITTAELATERGDGVEVLVEVERQVRRVVRRGVGDLAAPHLLVADVRAGGDLEPARIVVLDLDVLFARNVATEVEAMVQPGERTVRDPEAERRAIHVLPRVRSLPVHLRRPAVEPALRCVQALGLRVVRGPGRTAATRLPAQIGPAGDVPDAAGDLDCVPRRGRDVQPAVVHLALVLALDARAVLQTARGEVADPVAAARDAQVVVLQVAGPPDRGNRALREEVVRTALAVLQPLVLQLDDVDRLDLAVDLTVVHPQLVLRIPPLGALLHREVEARCSGRAPLRDDLDHPVRGLGAVQRGGRGALDDLDALDVVGIDVVPAGDGAGAECLADRAGRLRVVDADAVHVDERLVRKREASRAADADTAAAAKHTRSLDDGDARRAAVQQLGHRADGRLLDDVRRVHRRHGVTESAGRLPACSTR